MPMGAMVNQICSFRHIIPKLGKFFRLDLRSLAVFRVFLALIVIIDVLLRSGDFVDYYTEVGFVPMSLVPNGLSGLSGLTLFSFRAEAWFAVMLFVLLALSSFSLLIGYFTRLASAVTWVLVISLHSRCPFICYGADRVLAILLFWAIWLPLGARWAVDTKRNIRSETEFMGGAAFGFTLQVCFIYWMNAFNKADPVWRVDFTAVQLALSLDSYSTSVGESLLRFPALLRWAAKGTLWLEELGPFLLFSPVWRASCRSLAVFLFVSFHVVLLATTLHLGIFPFVCAVAWLPFIPGVVWDALRKSSHAESRAAFHAPRWQSICCVILTAYIILWNLRSALKVRDPWFFPRAWSDAGTAIGLQQHWNLYAPRPRSIDGWLVASAVLPDGRTVDLLNHGAPVSFERPRDTWERFSGSRERGYLQTLYFKPRRRLVDHFAEGLLRKWESGGGIPVTSLSVYMMLEDAKDPDRPPVRFRIWPYTGGAGPDLIFPEDPFPSSG